MSTLYPRSKTIDTEHNFQYAEHIRSKPLTEKEHIMTYSHVIWDWNGTLLDDLDWNIRCTNKLLEDRSLPVMADRAAYHRVFGFPIKDYYAKLGFDFDKDPYEELAVEWTALYYGNDSTASLFPDVTAALTAFANAGLHQSILSASERNHLLLDLEKHGIRNCFEEILGIDDVYAGSKIHLGKEYLSRVKPQKAVLLGDTLHDKETADSLGVDCILVSRGHQSRQSLLTAGCKVVGNLAEASALILNDA